MAAPQYVSLSKSGELKKRIERLKGRLRSCVVCPHHCRVDRTVNELGFCRAGKEMIIDGYGPHFGEEEMLVGQKGSGTIFFSYCTLRCVFCQNCEISHGGAGDKVSAEELARMMLTLQRSGCVNINLVSPTHYVPQIIEAIGQAIPLGLSIPIVYNTGGYEELDTLRLLDGIIDIYMPDIKFADNQVAERYTKSARYYDMVKTAVHEMYRQVGDMTINDEGVAERGLLVRHLVMPNQLAGTERIADFLAREISPNTLFHVMAQYYPAHKSASFADLNRRITPKEYNEAVAAARKAGLHNLMVSGF